MRRSLLIATVLVACSESGEPSPPAAADGHADPGAPPADPGTPPADAAPDADPPPGPVPPFQSGEGDHAGVAVVDITPAMKETFTDLNGNALFDGCRDDPSGTKEGCDEPFDDANGNGTFDPVFIAGFDPMRPALGVHDPLECRALVLSHGDEYIAIVALDVIGFGVDRIAAAKEALAAKGWDPERVLVSSTHNHQGPDTLGFYGNPEPGDIWNGADPAYNALVSERIVEAVELAADAVQPVSIRMGAVHMRDRSDWFNGPYFGGKNPGARIQGLIKDGRDPVIVSDQVFVLHAETPAGDAVATFVNFSGHPEVVGDGNNLISADYVHYLRAAVEAELGGRTVFAPECLGGMQSVLGADVPLVDPDGAWVFQTDEAGLPLLDADGEPIPVWAEKHTFSFAESVGRHLAAAVVDVVREDSEAVTLDPFIVRSVPLYIPVDNGAFQVLFSLGLFDIAEGVATRDAALCPDWNGKPLHPGCVPDRTWRVRLGPAEFMTVPGELLPELFWGFPEDDPRWLAEVADPSKRGTANGRDATYFPQHDPDCDAVPFEDCKNAYEVGDCDCLSFHALPYRLNDDPEVPPLATLLSAKYRFVLGAANDFLAYAVPQPDFNTKVSPLQGEDGDHYEDSVSVGFRFATKLQEAQLALDP